jgi:hypothetical protein
MPIRVVVQAKGRTDEETLPDILPGEHRVIGKVNIQQGRGEKVAGFVVAWCDDADKFGRVSYPDPNDSNEEKVKVLDVSTPSFKSSVSHCYHLGEVGAMVLLQFYKPEENDNEILVKSVPPGTLSEEADLPN